MVLIRLEEEKKLNIIALTAGIFAGGGAIVNEHFLKTYLKVARPNIIWLAGESGSGPLGMTAEQFYEMGDKEARRSPLASVLQQDPKPILLTPSIEAHWVEETGYSFPSGHSFSAIFFATFLLMIGTTYLSIKRLWLFYFLLPWALAVCYSRPILRLHTPAGISIGGLQVTFPPS
ncbi:phosphatase PAP2 family protein [Candidatus Vondammii sp. HM_W22]|uniref:phosphatase PAP2 family protein n=1 Tax=Candidatus Vondammii sp. HM_W22 TaxID=2687299 RepID=UPI001F12950F|nr:phosphatase PAP2 family protein [Candidatus Vondammii sp. HM_W22]